MFWADKIAADAIGKQVVNDSKTPSGRVHVGSLRGVIIHDVIYRALKHADKPVEFLYGSDDYDALDRVPSYLDQERFAPYLGFPLCNVPSPAGETGDYANHFMDEFLQVFDYLGVKPKIYYLRDLYRSGQLNPYIDRFLQNGHLVREAYLEVSKAHRPDDWYPFQVICENCGKIACSVVSDYQDGKVFYTCQPDATNWVKGCGHSGWISPFDGNGKLPWKVEWVAKWDLFGVTIEWAGKDHGQRGGSRDVANAICQKVLQKPAPFHAQFEFLLLNGTKMSSSKGVGSGGKEIADLLPAELLRFLMLRTQPKSVINFEPNYDTITRLFHDYDQLIKKYQQLAPEERTESALPEDVLPLMYAQLDGVIDAYQPVDFTTIISLLQVVHKDVYEEIGQRAKPALTEHDWQIARQRVAVAKKWLETYADEEDKLVLHLDKMPEKAITLDPDQRTYLKNLANHLANIQDWDAENLQTALFSTAKEQELPQNMAFKAIYLVLLNKEKGPKAGALLSYLERAFVVARFHEAAA
jgi:lysyl-tRNA synthetase class 1